MVRGFSSDRNVMLLSERGRLLSRTPLAVDCLCAAMARDANELMSCWRSASSKTHLLALSQHDGTGGQKHMLDERNRSARIKNDEVEGANYAAKAQLLHIHIALLDALYNYIGDI